MVKINKSKADTKFVHEYGRTQRTQKDTGHKDHAAVALWQGNEKEEHFKRHSKNAQDITIAIMCYVGMLASLSTTNNWG